MADIVKKAKMRLLLTSPFFGTLICTTPLILDTSIPTAATDMRVIKYNPAFFADKSLRQTMFVLAHEILHIALKHGLRRGTRDPLLWNIACDYAINLMLVEDGMEMVQGGLLDHKYKGMNADQIYNELIKEYPQGGKGGQGEGDDEGEGNQGQPGISLPQDVLGQDVQDPKVSSSAEAQELGQKIDQKVGQAANMARMAGNVPGGIGRVIDEILNPQVPWDEMLRHYMTAFVKTSESWSKRNRRFSDIYLPGPQGEAMGELVVIADQSGSVTPKENNQIAAEIQAMRDLLNPERIRVIWADTEVAGEQVFEQGQELELEPCGGGGTDMRVPIKRAEEFDPVVCILITDGHTPWPKGEPPYPLIVCCTTGAVVPVGQVVRVQCA